MGIVDRIFEKFVCLKEVFRTIILASLAEDISWRTEILIYSKDDFSNALILSHMLVNNKGKLELGKNESEQDLLTILTSKQKLDL